MVTAGIRTLTFTTMTSLGIFIADNCSTTCADRAADKCAFAATGKRTDSSSCATTDESPFTGPNLGRSNGRQGNQCSNK